jgi:hypothetical protein
MSLFPLLRLCSSEALCNTSNVLAFDGEKLLATIPQHSGRPPHFGCPQLFRLFSILLSSRLKSRGWTVRLQSVDTPCRSDRELSFFADMVRLSPNCGCQRTCCSSPRCWYIRTERWWNDDTDVGRPKNSLKNLSQCHFVHHKNPTRTDPGANPGLRGGRPGD